MKVIFENQLFNTYWSKYTGTFKFFEIAPIKITFTTCRFETGNFCFRLNFGRKIEILTAKTNIQVNVRTCKFSVPDIVQRA